MSASSLPAIASLSEIENHALVLMGIDFIGLIEIHKNDKVNRRPVSQRFVIFHQAEKRLNPVGLRLRDDAMRQNDCG